MSPSLHQEGKAGWITRASHQWRICCCAMFNFSVMSNSLRPVDCSTPSSSVHGISPGKNTGVGCHALLQGIFPTQGSNPGLLHCRRILYHLSHWGSPRILGWVTYPFSRGTSWPKNWTGISYIAGGFFTSWATREAPVEKIPVSICNS